MEIVTNNAVTSPGQSPVTGEVARSESGRSDFRAVLAKTETAARLPASLTYGREPGAGAPAGMNSGALINAIERDTERAPAVAGVGSRHPLPAADVHTVRPGETLYGISRKVLETRGLEVTPAAIMRTVERLSEYNGMTDRNRIYPNQQINTAVLNDLPGKPLATVNSPGSRADSFNPFVASGGNSHAFAPAAQFNAEPDPRLNQRNALTTSAFLAYSNAAMCREAPANNFYIAQNHADSAAAIAPSNLPQLPVMPDAGPEVFLPEPIALTESSSQLSRPASAPPSAGSGLPDIFYKGAIGKMLDYVPMESEKRATLQQAGSVVSGTTSGLKLAGLLGVATPIAAVVGLVWGIFSARSIEPAQTDSN